MGRTLGQLMATTILGLVLTACGSDGDGSGDSSATGSATRSVGSAQTFSQATEEGEGEAALGGALTLYGDLQTLSANAQATQASGLATARMPLDVLSAPLNASCMTQTANSITYTACESGGAVFDGTITTVGNDATIDLTMTLDPSAAGVPAGTPGQVKGVTVHETGTLTITPTSIDGTVNVDVAVEVDISQAGLPAGIPGGGSVSINTAIKAIFDVTLEMGCAVGGTLVVESTTAGAPGQGGSNAVTSTATFGPTCGEAQIQ